MRQIVLDTETTGLYYDQGHRVIEIGCVEILDRKITSNHFHHYINPERDIDAEALEVHGITEAFLKDKPLFKEIHESFLDYIAGAELIIHNADFDVGFLNFELGLLRAKRLIHHICHVTDSLALAKKKHIGQKNSLDALCKRYSIDNTHREYHGALLDAHLLARVYLAMTGGQVNLFQLSEDQLNEAQHVNDSLVLNTKSFDLKIITASAEECAEHQKYLAFLEEQKTAG